MILFMINYKTLQALAVTKAVIHVNNNIIVKLFSSVFDFVVGQTKSH